MSATSFPCSHCGARLDGVPGSAMSCPYCQAKVLAPDMRVVNQLADDFLSGLPPEARTPHARGAAIAQILASAGGAVSSSGHAPGGDDDEDVVGTTDSVAIALDPQLGPVVVRVFSPVGVPPVVQAYDVRQKRVLWEAFKGQTWMGNLEAASFRILGRNVYIANKRNLVVLDLASGNQKWGAQLPDEISRVKNIGEEPRLVVEDAFPPNQPGAILVKTEDHVLSAFDRDSGRPLYQRTFGKDSSDFTIQIVPNGQVAAIVYGFPYNKCEIVNPAYPQPLSRHGEGPDGDWSTDLGACTLFGRTVVTRVESFGPETDQDGALCFDALSGQRHFFVQAEDLEEDIVPETIGGRVFFGANGGEAMWVGPEGRLYPSPAQGFRILAWRACGPTLFVLLVKARGTEVRRVIGLDPGTLAMRFDCGMIGTEPSNLGREVFQSDGQTVVYVASPQDDSSDCELVAVDAAGGFRIWAKPIGDYVSHHIVLGHVLVRSEEKLFVFSLRQGQEIAVYP
jgi:DNA-directed RNA polymerase subunit RPC12/RpoP/outer membrane protein assembly factor BamB